tara:strand:+ start:91 stop:321 length:231 start_codon:yes stop_codon:yes gene_type:complete
VLYESLIFGFHEAGPQFSNEHLLEEEISAEYEPTIKFPASTPKKKQSSLKLEDDGGDILSKSSESSGGLETFILYY